MHITIHQSICVYYYFFVIIFDLVPYGTACYLTPSFPVSSCLIQFFFIVYMIKYVSHVTVTHYPNVYCTTVHTDSKEILSHLTSDLRAACETDWH